MIRIKFVTESYTSQVRKYIENFEDYWYISFIISKETFQIVYTFLMMRDEH